MIGTARETTSALLNEFKRLGFIDMRHRRIKILEQWQLKKIADAKMKEFSIKVDPEEESEVVVQ